MTMSELRKRARFRRDHRWAPGHMSAFLDGELGSPRQARMKRHARDCPECRWLLGSLQRTVQALQRLPAGGVTGRAPQIAAAVRRRLDEPPAP
jgi:anti-sigma factor RsiW